MSARQGTVSGGIIDVYYAEWKLQGSCATHRVVLVQISEEVLSMEIHIRSEIFCRFPIDIL